MSPWLAGGHDILGDPEDEAKLAKELPSSSIVYRLKVDDYAHLDFAWGEDAYRYIYPHVLALLQNYTSVVS